MSSARSAWRLRVRSALVAGVALNLLVLGAWTLPRLVEERDLLGRAASLEEELTRDRARNSALRQRQATVAANTADTRVLLQERLPERATGLLPLLEEVESAARAAGLKLTSRSYAEEPFAELPVSRVQITLPADGTYRQLVDFVQRLERSDRFLVVDRVQLRELRSAGGQLNVTLSAFFKAAPESRDEA